MKSPFQKILAIVILLAITMGTKVAGQNVEGEAPNYDPNGTVEWQKMITIADRKRDDAGKLLPLQSYEETIRRGMSFLLVDHLLWF